jgi:hypothetical protein
VLVQAHTLAEVGALAFFGEYDFKYLKYVLLLGLCVDTDDLHHVLATLGVVKQTPKIAFLQLGRECAAKYLFVNLKILVARHVECLR